MILPLLACLTLVGASSAPLAVSFLPYANESLPQFVVYDDSAQEITLDIDEVNTYLFENLFNALVSIFSSEQTLPVSISYSSVSTGDINFSFDEYDSHYFSWTNSAEHVISINNDFLNYLFTYTDRAGADELSGVFAGGLLLDCSTATSSYYQSIKTAIQADISANQSGMSGVEVVNEIVDILAGGLTSLGSSLGGAIATFAQSLAFQDGELSVYFVLIVVFAGVSLAIGLTTLLFNWLTNLGK